MRLFGWIPASKNRSGRHRRGLRALLAPLSRRERLIYGLLAGGIVLAIFGPRVGANFSSQQSIIYSPASQCVATESGWLNPSLAEGVPETGNFGARSAITERNSALSASAEGSLNCFGFVATSDVVTELAVTISAKAVETSDVTSNQPASEGVEEGTSTDLVLNNASADPIVSESRASPVDPNKFGDQPTDSLLDNILRLDVSADGGDTWQTLHAFGSELINDRSPHFSVKLPERYSVNIADLAFRLEQVTSDEMIQILVDSVFIAYHQGLERETSLRTKEAAASGPKGVPLLSDNSEAQFELRSKLKTDGLIQGIGGAIEDLITPNDEPSIEISAKIQNAQTGISQDIEVDAVWSDRDLANANSWDIKIAMPSQSDPGLYTLIFTTVDGENTQTVTQDFLWGVLAMNSNKTIYQTGETASIFMTVLDERGRTLCDATLTLLIELDGQQVAYYSTNDESIIKGSLCEEYGGHIDPDYFAEHLFDSSGNYQLSLTAETENGTYSIDDVIEVQDEISLSIERSGPTRIFPPLSYPMSLRITSEKGFTGELIEIVPPDFKISFDEGDLNAGSINHLDTHQEINWQLQLDPGEELVASYQFDAPDISPEFYLLGPAQLTAANESVESFTEIRQWQIAGDAVGRMLMLWDGASVPSGWTCVSCTSGDPFYQRLIRGDATYGGTGGTANHGHTASGSVDATTDAQPSRSKTPPPNEFHDNGHSHSFSPTILNASNLPSYRQLQIIRNNTSGEPGTLPAGVIGFFDATVPSGWTRYSAQDGRYIYGENTVGTNGGSNTHTHNVTGTTSAAAGSTVERVTNSTQADVADLSHTHDGAGTSNASNHEPPYVEMYLGKLDADAAPPDNLYTMWDDSPPTGWDSKTDSGDALHQKYIKPANGYGTTAGNTTHTHTDSTYASGVPSATTTSRVAGTPSGSDDQHTHTINVTNFSTDNHVAPYVNAIIAKKEPQPTLEQSAYRWFRNQDSTDVGSTLAAQDTAANAPKQSVAFRLRFLLHVGNADRGLNGSNLKLQFSQKSGSCDTSFIGETYNDVSPTSGAIRYYNNATPADGANLTSNTNDPTHSSHTVEDQTYEESNDFTNSVTAIQTGEDGMWDVALVDNSATASTSYCFRVVYSTGALLDTYTVIPEITTDDGAAHMLLFWDGASDPSGWSCVSCNPGDEYYQRFVRGESSWGGTGDGTHDHTATASLDNSSQSGRSIAGTGLISQHTHTLTPTIGSATYNPPYRQLKIIRADASGTPGTIPANAIAIFDAAVPAGWTRYSAQDGNYVRGEGTVGSTGGSTNHNHSVTGTTSGPSTGTVSAPDTSSTQVPRATDSHTHDVNGTTNTPSLEPPYIETILGQKNAAGAAPTNMLAMWDGTPPVAWTVQSNSGGAFYQRFMKPAATYGTTGGSTTHSHTTTSITTSAASDSTDSRSGGATVTADTHTHTATVSSYSSEAILPPYMNTIIAKLTGTNTAPNSPTALDQINISDSSSISVGGWSDSTSVKFSASATDPDNPDDLSLCVEAQPLGTAFTNTETLCGSAATYSGTAITVDVTLLGLTNTAEYHWQARIKDSFGAYSGWVSFGGNAESARDFAVDDTDPSGTVYDGTTIGVDVDYNNGALDELSANWSFSDADSGINDYEYSIGTTIGGTDIVNWTNVGTDTSVTASALTLNTSQPYYFNVRASDVAGNVGQVSS
ncbi:MAG: hypothetical protein R3313_03705, partial [Candidatus Saccharimonadales bacterium]|nr:hypothetical protein [Candidatus Saccharimonadales bacterium]